VKTDAKIKQDVLNELKWDPEIKEEHVGVTVHHGAVTLTGHVPTYREKVATKEAAKRVADVKAVVDDIDVRLENAMRMTDEGLAERIANVLRWNVSGPGGDVKAEVKGGVVTLTGEVNWQHQRGNIARSIEHVRGVRNIVNLIIVKPLLSTGDVRQRIREALQRHADIEASKIDVDVLDGTVTLSGTVESLVEMDRVEDAAWAAPGVSKVVDNLSVAIRSDRVEQEVPSLQCDP
jgi:osmotically-inducible protein OsmY